MSTRKMGLLMGLVVGVLLLLLAPTPAQADGCWVGGLPQGGSCLQNCGGVGPSQDGACCICIEDEMGCNTCFNGGCSLCGYIGGGGGGTCVGQRCIESVTPGGEAAKVQAPAMEPPREIACLNIITGSGKNEKSLHVDLDKPTAVTHKGIALQFLHVTQEMVALGGSEEQKQLGFKLLLVAARGNWSYQVGRVCYVLQNYCDSGCTGQGCATIRVPSIQ